MLKKCCFEIQFSTNKKAGENYQLFFINFNYDQMNSIDYSFDLDFVLGASLEVILTVNSDWPSSKSIEIKSPSFKFDLIIRVESVVGLVQILTQIYVFCHVDLLVIDFLSR